MSVAIGMRRVAQCISNHDADGGLSVMENTSLGRVYASHSSGSILGERIDCVADRVEEGHYVNDCDSSEQAQGPWGE